MMNFFSKTIAFCLLLLLSPFIIIIALFSILFDGFPIIYKQQRIGLNYVPFEIYKFRTMVRNKGQLITESNDSRITKWGKILRYTKIDEIPQLINIIKGDMRFVGPRPEVDFFLNDNDFSFLLTIKPGLTDFSSIILRNESNILGSSKKTYFDLLNLKIKLGHLYSSNKSFFLDLKIVFITLYSIIFPSSAIKIILKYFIVYYDKNLIKEIEQWI